MCCDLIASMPFRYYFKHCKCKLQKLAINCIMKLSFFVIFCVVICWVFLLYILLASYFTYMSDSPNSFLKMRYELEKENTKPKSMNSSNKVRDEELQPQESFTALVQQVTKKKSTHRRTVNISQQFSTFNLSEQTFLIQRSSKEIISS